MCNKYKETNIFIVTWVHVSSTLKSLIVYLTFVKYTSNYLSTPKFVGLHIGRSNSTKISKLTLMTKSIVINSSLGEFEDLQKKGNSHVTKNYVISKSCMQQESKSIMDNLKTHQHQHMRIHKE